MIRYNVIENISKNQCREIDQKHLTFINILNHIGMFYYNSMIFSFEMIQLT